MPLMMMLCLLAGDRLPPAELNLRLAAPITTWDEALPLGNGLLGGLMWGQDGTLRLSLDRGDLWDERPARGVPWERFNYAEMVRLKQAGRIDEINRIFDNPYNDVYPTKIPAGRLELDLPDGARLESFELDLASAEGRALLTDGRLARCFFDANQPVALLTLPGEPRALRLRAPESVKKLGYADPTLGHDAGADWFVQQAAGDLRYCVFVARRRVGPNTLLAITVTSSTDSPDPRALAARRCAQALDRGYERLASEHRRWWQQFWSASAVHIPQDDILRHYYLVQYFHGAASRRGAPPMPLQGVWTADAGGLPPWKGDYHNDLNTQMTYIAYQAAGHFDEGLSFLDFNWSLLPRYRRFAKEFYGVDGAAVPGVMTLHGEPLGGWGQYSLSPTMGAWIGHLFYLHWRYTQDREFLRTRALPWCREVGTALRALMKVDPADGRLKLPLSTSPEIHDASLRAFLTPMTNYDLACSKTLFVALADMAGAADLPQEAARWRVAADLLGEFHTRPDGTLKLDTNEDLAESHRHLSNLIGIHPFGLLSAEVPAQQRVIEASLRDWDRLGTRAWCGYSFSWMSCLRARVGDGEAALRNLDIYTKAFILRNGFHANGDQTKSGFSGFQYRPFTLEGNFLAAQAVQEMLLSGAPERLGGPGLVTVFPAMPWRWHEASFDDLRCEGGHRVSARRANNATVWLRIVAGTDGPLRLRDNFGGRAGRFSQQPERRDGVLTFRLRRGDVLEASFDAPTAPPPAPANAAEPVVIARPSVIRANRLPLRIGADSQGNNRFAGELAAVLVYPRALTDAELSRLADNQPVPGAVVALDMTDLLNHGSAPSLPKLVGSGRLTADGPTGHALALDGGYLELPDDRALDCLQGVTLAAWVKPAAANGPRLIDKSPVGEASGYLLDMHPGASLRLIHRDPHVTADAKLPVGQWSHVAAVVDVAADEGRVYLGGRRLR